jgi:hypothetical protein
VLGRILNYCFCSIVPGIKIGSFPKVQLLTAQGSGGFSLAPVEYFDIEASLYYSDSRSPSQCLQGSNDLMPCLGICTTNAQLCNQTCPRFFDYTGKKYSDFQASPYLVQDSNGTIDERITGMILAVGSCSYTLSCPGRKGESSCENIRINRAGIYLLKFSFPSCQRNGFRPWETVPQPCQSPSIFSTTFEVIADNSIIPGSMADITTPGQNTIHQLFLHQSNVEVVDGFGNLVHGAIVKVSLFADNHRTSQANSVRWPQYRNFFVGSLNLTQDISATEMNIGGNRSAVSKRGYAVFTDLKIEIALKQAILVFSTDNGVRTFSQPFEVKPGRIAAMKIRQQPYVWEAGRFMLFEIGLLDSDMFLVQNENIYVFMEVLVDDDDQPFSVKCPPSSKSCWKSVSENGFVQFNFSVSKAGKVNSIRFFTNSTSLDPWARQSQNYAETESLNLSVIAAPFFIFHTYPNKIIVSGPPLHVISQRHFALTAELSDEFDNPFIRSSEFPVELGGFQFRIGCDSILMQRVCDVDLCSSYPLSEQSIGDCCLIPKTLQLNNMFNCSLETTSPKLGFGHSFHVQLDFRNSSGNQVITLNDSNLEYSIQRNSTYPVLGGILKQISIGRAFFANLSIGQVGEYSLLVSVLNMTSKTGRFYVGKFFFLHLSYFQRLKCHHLSADFGDFMKIHILSLMSTQSAGTAFSVSALLCDGYGNVVLGPAVKVNLSIQTIAQDNILWDWPLAEQTSRHGALLFTGLFFNKTQTICNMNGCTRAWSRIMLSSEICFLQTQCRIVRSASNRFVFDAAKASKLILLSHPPKLWIATSSYRIKVQVQDDFGNVVISRDSCSKICVSGSGQPPNSQYPTVRNSNNSCLEHVNGQADFELSLDYAEKNSTIQFYCISSANPSTRSAKLYVTDLEVVVLQKIFVTSQPRSTLAGNILVPQPVVQLCGSNCIEASECCLFNSSGIVRVDSPPPEAGGLVGNLDALIIEGIGTFTNLKVRTIC